MSRPGASRRPLVGHGLALALPLAALWLRTTLPVSFGDRPLLILFVPPIILAALVGGLGPGLLATVVTGVLTAYFLVPPTGSFALGAHHDLFQWALLLASGLLVSLLSGALHRRRSNERERRQELEAVQDDLRRSQEQQQRSAARLRRLAELVEEIAGVRDLAGLMAVVRHGLRELTGADGATLVLRENGDCHYVDEDAIGPLWKGQRFPLENCISGWAMLHGEPAVIEDIYADPRIPHEAYRATFVRSLSMMPVGRRQPVAAIGCYWASRHRASEEELELQQALADAMAVGLDNLNLYAELTAARRAAEAATEEVRARAAALRENEAFIKSVLDNLPVGIAVNSVDPAVHFSYMNDQFPRTYRTRREALENADAFWDTVYEDAAFRAEIRRRVLEDCASGDAARMQWDDVPITRQGEPTTYVSARNIPLPDKGLMISMVWDVTERKAAEESLRASRELLRSVLENAPIRIFWKDADLRYLGGNTLFARDAGLAGPEDLIGKDDYQMGWREQADLYRADDRRVMETGTPRIGYEEPQTTPDGRRLWLRTSKVPLRDAGGRVIGLLGIYDDVTASKEVEAALVARNQELERFNEAMVDREHAMIALKREINALARELGRAPIHALDFLRPAPDADGRE